MTLRWPPQHFDQPADVVEPPRRDGLAVWVGRATVAVVAFLVIAAIALLVASLWGAWP